MAAIFFTRMGHEIKTCPIAADYFTVTFTVAFAFLLFLQVTVMVVVPFFFALILPVLDTVAIFLLFTLYVKLLQYAFFGVKLLTEICAVLPFFRLIFVFFNLIFVGYFTGCFDLADRRGNRCGPFPLGCNLTLIIDCNNLFVAGFPAWIFGLNGCVGGLERCF